MRKLVIAVDCDDVIVSTAPATLDYYNHKYGTNVPLRDFYSNDLSLWKAPDNDTAVRRFNEFIESEEFFDLAPTKEAIGVLQDLAAYHELHVVTGRPDFVEASTLAWLQRHLPDIFKTAVFTNYFTLSDGIAKPRSKAEVCQEIGADYLIDDHLHHAEMVASEGINVLLFGDFPWNQADTLPPRVTRVDGWTQVRKILLPDEPLI